MPLLEQPETSSDALLIDFVPKPSFGVVERILPIFANQIEGAVKDFIKSSHISEDIDHEGFYYQTLEAIANSTYMRGGGDFWMGVKDNELLIYIIAHVGKDLDNRLAYTVSQAWVRKDYRGNPIVKEWWEAIRQRAKDLFCKHLVIISSRNPEAYERFLGHGMKLYATMLKESL